MGGTRLVMSVRKLEVAGSGLVGTGSGASREVSIRGNWQCGAAKYGVWMASTRRARRARCELRMGVLAAHPRVRWHRRGQQRRQTEGPGR